MPHKFPLKIHFFLHASFEDPGCILQWCRDKGHQTSSTHLYRNESLPELNDFDWLIVMGGPIGVYEEEKYTWLAGEKYIIRQAVDSGKTVVGICLGAQLLANALGAEVYRNPEKEIGWFDVMLTESGEKESLFGGMSPRINVFHWHGDTFDLPDGATHLMYSEACRNQAFLYGEKVLGLQFHFEVTGSNVLSMVENCRSEIVPGKYIQTEEEILRVREAVTENNRIMFELLDRLSIP